MLEGEIQGRAPRKNQPKIEKPGFLDPRFLAVVVVVFSLSLSLSLQQRGQRTGLSLN